MDREKQLINELNELTDEWCVKNDFNDLDGHLMEEDNPLLSLHALIENSYYDYHLDSRPSITPELEERILKQINLILDEREHDVFNETLENNGIALDDIKEHQQALHEYRNGGI